MEVGVGRCNVSEKVSRRWFYIENYNWVVAADLALLVKERRGGSEFGHIFVSMVPKETCVLFRTPPWIKELHMIPHHARDTNAAMGGMIRE